MFLAKVSPGRLAGLADHLVPAGAVRPGCGPTGGVLPNPRADVGRPLRSRAPPSSAAGPRPSPWCGLSTPRSDRDVQIVGIFDDRDEDRSPPWSPAIPSSAPSTSSSSSPAAPARPRHLHAADHGRERGSCSCSSKLWVLPVDIRLVGPHQQAALPAARLFLHRLRAGARRVRQADRRLGRRDEVALRQIVGSARSASSRSRRSCSLIALAIKLDSRGPGAVPAAALRLQQRDHRGLQIPLDVCRPDADPTAARR